MWPWRKPPPELAIPDPKPLPQWRVDMEERMVRLEMRQRAMDVEIEDFVSKVSAAAKRAYKREMDAERHEAKADPAAGRSGRKAQLRARLLQGGG